MIRLNNNSWSVVMTHQFDINAPVFAYLVTGTINTCTFIMQWTESYDLSFVKKWFMICWTGNFSCICTSNTKYTILRRCPMLVVMQCWTSFTFFPFSCNVGDLALFCLDDRHDQYVVFTIGNTLHFLHTDCQDTLGLKPSKYQ